MDRLKAAERAQGAAQQELTREAVAQLQQVPLACNLDFLTAQLTRLHYYQARVGAGSKATAGLVSKAESGRRLRVELSAQ